jgi:hypothetical protein
MSYANIAILAASGQTNCNAGQTAETGKWKLETRNSKLGIGRRKVQFPVSIFYFPLSSFHFPAPCSTQFLTNRRLWADFLALIGVSGPENWVRFELLKRLTPLLSIDS